MRKPQAWNVDPAYVAPDWRWAWRGSLSFTVPFWTGGTSLCGQVPTLAGDPNIRPSHPGPAAFFDKTANSNAGEALNYGRGPGVPTFPETKQWSCACMFRTFGTAHDDQVIFAYTEAGSFVAGGNHFLLRLDKGAAPQNFEFWNGNAKVDGTEVIGLDQWYVVIAKCEPLVTTVFFRVYRWPTGELIDSFSDTGFGDETDVDSAFCMGRSDGTVSGNGHGDEMDGEIALFHYVEDVTWADAQCDRLALQPFEFLRYHRSRSRYMAEVAAGGATDQLNLLTRGQHGAMNVLGGGMAA